MAVDNTMTPAEDYVDYGDAQSTSRNTTQQSDHSTGTSNSNPMAAFMRVQKLDSVNPGSNLGGEAYCPCEGGFAIR